DSTRLASLGEDKTVRVWDVASGKELRQLATQGEPFSLALAPNGRLLAMGSEHAKRPLRLVDLTTGKERGPLSRAESRELAKKWDFLPGTEPRFGANAVAFSPDGRTLASAETDQAIRLWETISGELRAVLRHPGNVTRVAFSPD